MNTNLSITTYESELVKSLFGGLFIATNKHVTEEKILQIVNHLKKNSFCWETVLKWLSENSKHVPTIPAMMDTASTAFTLFGASRLFTKSVDPKALLYWSTPFFDYNQYTKVVPALNHERINEMNNDLYSKILRFFYTDYGVDRKLSVLETEDIVLKLLILTAFVKSMIWLSFAASVARNSVHNDVTDLVTKIGKLLSNPKICRTIIIYCLNHSMILSFLMLYNNKEIEEFYVILNHLGLESIEENCKSFAALINRRSLSSIVESAWNSPLLKSFMLNILAQSSHSLLGSSGPFQAGLALEHAMFRNLITDESPDPLHTVSGESSDDESYQALKNIIETLLLHEKS